MHKNPLYPLKDLTDDLKVLPKEQLQKVKNSHKEITLGIPREIHHAEKRIALTPFNVKLLSGYGYKIIIQKGAGSDSFFSDHEYAEAGADITDNVDKVYQCDYILKVAFPEVDEIKKIKSRSVLISALDLPLLTVEKLRLLMEKKLTAICYEYLKDSSGIFPVIQSMSEIAGKQVIQIAAHYLAEPQGKGRLLGGVTGIPPIEIVIIGAGTVGQYAAMAAFGLGASVKIFDQELYRLKRLQSTTSISFPNSLIQPENLNQAVQNADVVITALRAKNGRSPIVMTEDMVMSMKDGAILIDVSIDQGGCCETSRVTSLDDPVFVKHGVVHYCVPNIPSRVPRTASMALGNIFTPLLIKIIESPSFNTFLWENYNIRNGIYIYQGILTNVYLGNKFNISGKNIDLLLTTNL